MGMAWPWAWHGYGLCPCHGYDQSLLIIIKRLCYDDDAAPAPAAADVGYG